MPCQSVRKTSAAPSHLHERGIVGRAAERSLARRHAPVDAQGALKGDAEDMQPDGPACDGQQHEAEADGERVAHAPVHAPALAVVEELMGEPNRRRHAAGRDAAQTREDTEAVAAAARGEVPRGPLPEVRPQGGLRSRPARRAATQAAARRVRELAARG